MRAFLFPLIAITVLFISSDILYASTAKNNTLHTIIVKKTSKHVESSPGAKQMATSTLSSQSAVSTAVRLLRPYHTPPLTFNTVNDLARGALVNIICIPTESPSMQPISGSGVIIDPNGTILTNAHVAQYVFLAQYANVDLSCSIRSGSPATNAWKATVTYISPSWVHLHAGDIQSDHPMGTGDHDYALLRITTDMHGAASTHPFSYVSVDSRANVAFLNDSVLGIGYPAEFAGGSNTLSNLYAISSVSPIREMLTLATSTLDLISIGGVAEAQAGSSGGPVLNQWGNMVGMITTTSSSSSTKDRDLRALTLSYIARDFKSETGIDLNLYVSSSTPSTRAYNDTVIRELTGLYIKNIH